MFLVRTAAFVVIACALLSACQKKEVVNLSNLIVREAPPGKTVTAAYLRIDNSSKESLVLNYVHSSIADRIEVHRHLYSDGKMMMREVKHLTVDPSSALEFEPGGYHLMLFDIDENLSDGSEIEMTFEFEGRAPMKVKGLVKRL